MLSALRKKFDGQRGFAMLMAGLLTFAALAASPATAMADAVSQTIATGDYPADIVVNPVTNKIYVANRIDSTVTVINCTTNATVSVPLGGTPIAIAVNTLTNKVYVATNSNSITVIDGATDTADPTPIPTGFGLNAIAVNPAANMIYTANNSGTVTVINGATNTVASTITGMDYLRSIAVNPVTKRAYVTDEGAGKVYVIDCVTNTIVESIQSIYGVGIIAVDPVLNRIYTTYKSNSYVTVINGNDNSVAYVRIGSGLSTYAIVADPLTGKAYITGLTIMGVTVIDRDNNTSTISLDTYPYAIALNSTANKLYTVNSEANSVTVIDGATNTVLATVAVGTNPAAAAVNPVTGKVYVANSGSDSVTVIDCDTNSATNLTTEQTPWKAAINPATGKVYVTNLLDGNITVIDGATNDTTTVPVGSRITDVAVNAVTNKIYISNYYNNAVTVIDGATNATAKVAVVDCPGLVKVNPVTNRIYVASNGSKKYVTVIDGASNTIISSVQLSKGVAMLAVNPVTNMIYATMQDDNKVIVINGATNTITAEIEIPVSGFSGTLSLLELNPQTNKIYVTSSDGSEITVIDGVTNNITPVNLGRVTQVLVVNTVTNKIYAANYNNSVITVIDGATNATASISAVSNPLYMAVNPATNKLYVGSHSNVIVIDCTSNAPIATLSADSSSFKLLADPASNKLYVTYTNTNNITVIDAQNEQPGLLTTVISPLPHNATCDATPTFEFTAASAYAPNASISQIYYQVDTMHGLWIKADSPGSSASATLPELTKGTHTLYAFATDGMESTSINISPANGSIPGAVSAYAFTVVGYQVDVTTANAEFGTVTGGGTFSHAEEVTVHAVPKAGYHLTRWTQGGTEVSTDTDYTFDVMGMRTLTAEFALNNYTITAAANNEAYGSVTGGGTFDHGAAVTLRATPAAGYHFTRWTEGGAEVSSSAEYSFTAEKARTLTAEFAINQYTVNAAVNNTAYGKVTGDGTYDQGASVTLQALASTGCRFVRWTENGFEVSASAEYTFTVDKERSLTAVFEAVTPETIPVTITCSKTDVDKYGASTGSITVTAAGGNSGAFLYSIDGGINWQPSGSFAYLAAGSYTALARDANNAANVSAAVAVTISQPRLAWTGLASKMPAKVKASTAWVVKPAAKPRGYTFKSVKYASSNTGIASVDKNGNVTFLRGGRVRLTVTTVFQKGKRLKTVRSVRYVTVTQLVSSITLNKAAAELKVRKKLKLIPKINPYSATNKRVKWKSSNTRIATVSSSGVVTARKAGTVVITCTAQDGSKATVKCVITVK